MLRRLNVLCFVLPALFSGYAGEARPPDATLPEVIVTAPKDRVPPAQPAPQPSAALKAAEQSVKSTPGGADVIGTKELNKGRTESFEDLLRHTPGVFVESNNAGANVKVSIRGSGIQSEDVIGITVMLDGLPYNEGDGEVVLEDIGLNAIKGAEIQRGSNALRYGSTTLGGVINLLARTGYDAERLEGRFEAGSYGYFQETINSGGVKGPWDYFFSVTDVRTDGYQDHSRENNQKFSGNFGRQINDCLSNRFYAGGSTIDREKPGGLTRSQLHANPRQAGDDAIEQDFHLNSESLRLADKLTYAECDRTLSAGVFFQYRNLTEKQFFDPTSLEGILRFHSDDFGALLHYEDLGEMFGRKNRLTVGMLPTIEYEDDDSFENNDGRQGARLNADRTLAINVPIYAEMQHYLTDTFSLIGGFQFSYIDRDFRDLFRPSGVADQSHRQQFYGYNPRFGLMYDYDDNTQIFGNVSRNFQPPSFDDLAAVQEDSADGVIYRSLRAQRGTTVEVGARGKSGRVSWEASLYSTRLTNELLALNNAHGDSIGTINANVTQHRGIELGLEADLFRGICAKGCNGGERDSISLRQSYTLNDFRFSGDPIFRNHRIAGIPPQRFSGALEYNHPCGFYSTLGLDWSVKKFAVDHANTLYADQYALLNFRLGYRCPKGITLFVDARNLTNRKYAATVEPQSDARGDAPDAFMPGIGRAFYGGISFKW